MSVKHVFSDWLEIEAGYGKAQEGFKPANASPYGVELKQHSPEVDYSSTAIPPDKPWESWRVGSYISFAEDNGKYKCWYESYTPWYDYNMFLCYAESDDGLNWIKPSLGKVDFQGSKDNNIIRSGRGTPYTEGGKQISHSDHGYFVFHDKEAPASERFKMAFTRCTTVDGVRTQYTMSAFSADGIDWKVNDIPICQGGDTQMALTKCGDTYIAYTRKHIPEIIHRRTIIYIESKDFVNWSEPHFVKTNDPMDPPDVDYYTANVVKWDGCEKVFVSLQPKYFRTADVSEIYLEMSRNGHEFRPVTREPYIKRCEKSPYNGFVIPSSGIIDLHDGRWLMHFATSAYTHNDKLDIREYPSGFLARAYLREDGFVSLHSESYGSCQSQPLYVTGDDMELNCEYLDKGYIRIGIIDDKEDKIVEGFEPENCLPVEMGRIWQTVSWKNGKTLKDLSRDKRYRIRFDLFKADIFAYKF